MRTPPAAHINLGKALLDLKRPEEALAVFDRAITLEPNLAMAHNNRATALLKLKRPEEALARCDKAIALAPNLVMAHNNRGTTLNNLKRPKEALASFDRAIELEPDFAEAHNNRGNALLGLKRDADALASFEHAISQLPYNAHTTASNALWAGLPVLTCVGETFVGRVAASLLNAIHLPELITTIFEEYERMAVDLLILLRTRKN